MPSGIVIGAIWSFIQRFGGLAIGFVSNMVLARLLCPEDFGTMGMVMVFVSMADVLVDGGLGNALIQKKDLSKDDISTVFSSNLTLSIFLFTLCFIAAPAIESYTKIANLSLFLRVESVLILIRAFYIIPASLLSKNLQFRVIAKINLMVAFLSVCVSISMAYAGAGVWSLLCRNIVSDLLLTIAYFIISKAPVEIGFKMAIFKKLFGFGFFVVLSNLIESAYANIINFFIGKKYDVKELGYYSQAYALQQIPVYSMTSVLNQVLFPYFSKIQDDTSQLQSKLKISIQTTTFCVFPLMAFLMTYAGQVIEILYSEKWMPCVPYFQLFCISGCFNALIHINRSLLKSQGYTRMIFILQLLNAIIGTSLLIWALKYDIIMAVITYIINTIILFVATTYFAGLKINYSILQQLKDISPNLIITLICIILTYLCMKHIKLSLFFNILFEFLMFASLYIFFHAIIKTQTWETMRKLLKPISRTL